MTGVVSRKTRVLAGARVEVSAPELVEGELVDVLIMGAASGLLADETAEERARRFREWADSHDGFVTLDPSALDRESFYGDRG